MDNNNPKVTIVTVCYNAARDIEPTLLSVIGQTYDNLEYIVIDGGSTDGTCDIIGRYSARIDHYVSEPDHGVYDAMNKAVMSAHGEWILFMNSGDTFYSDDTVAKAFDGRIISDEVGILYGDTVFVEDDKRSVKKFGDFKVHSIMPSCHQSIFCRTQLLKDNPFNLKYRYAADYDLFFRLKKNGVKQQYTDSVVSVYDARCGLSKDNQKKVRMEIQRCTHSLPVFLVAYPFSELKRYIGLTLRSLGTSSKG